MNGPWAYAPPALDPARRGPADRWLVGLSVLLFGYAVFGRSFAYLGVPPIFIGEVMLAGGLALLLLVRRPVTLIAAPPMAAAAALLAWVALRTVPYLSGYGLDAPRDAMVAGYALYAAVVAALVLQRPERLPELLVRYRVLVLVLCGGAWLLYLIVRSFQESVPTLPWAPDVHVIANKPGDLVVHMAGVVAFVVLGWRRAGPVLLALMVVGSAALMVGNRGGMVGFLLAMGVFAVLKPRSARAGRMVYALALLIVLGLAVDTSHLSTNEGNRSISVEQLWENLKSVVGKSDQQMLSTTTEWRKEWWSLIVGYTVHGEYRWTGKGFGRNIAVEDGFKTDDEGSLRSPHSVHMTLLARGGLPGVALWALVHGLWWIGLLRAWRFARHHDLQPWMGFFALCAVYWTAAVVNASFDVYLEGPMGAIWFWTVFGAAVAGTRLVRAYPHLLDRLPDRVPVSTAHRAPTWAWPGGDGASSAVPAPWLSEGADRPVPI